MYFKVLFRHSPEFSEENHELSGSEQAVSRRRIVLGGQTQAQSIVATPSCISVPQALTGCYTRKTTPSHSSHTGHGATEAAAETPSSLSVNDSE
jgi:hypothetical protein